MLNPRPLDTVGTPAQAMSAVASAVGQAVPAGREIAADIAAGVTDLVEGATNAVSEFLGKTGEPEAASPEAGAKTTRGASAKTPKASAARKGASKSATPRTKKTPEV